MPEATLLAFADHGEVRGVLAADGGDADATLARIGQAGIDAGALAAELQVQGRDAFITSFDQVVERVGGKMQALRAA
jgi:transaldolase